MKKFIILWFMALFILGCYSKNTDKKDILINSFIINNEEIQMLCIEKDLNYFLKKFNRNWNKEDKQRFIKIIYYGQKEFKIDYKIVMSIIAIESQYKINARGKNKNSIDFGLSQQNSKYIKQRYNNAIQYLNQYKISYTNSNYDIGKNIFSCYIYLKNITSVPEIFHFKDYILSYNQGVKGALRNNNDSYYHKFMKEYMEI